MRNHWFDIFIVILGLVFAFCLTELGTTLAVLAAITVIGLPITMAMAVVPLVFLFLLLTRIFYLVVGRFLGRSGWVAGAVFAVLVLAAIPFSVNQGLDREARALTADDLTYSGEGGAIETLGLVRMQNGWRGGGCGELCQRLLLNGHVKGVITIVAKAPADPIRLPAGRLYRIVEKPDCELEPLQTARAITPSPNDETDGLGPAELLRQWAAAGRCLVSQEAPANVADALLVFGTYKRGLSAQAAGLDPFADTVSAQRLTFFRRDKNTFEPAYRRTAVTYLGLSRLLWPTYADGYGLQFSRGFARRKIEVSNSKLRNAPDTPAAFVQRGLKLDLALRDTGAGEERRRLIEAALDDGDQDRPAGDVVDGVSQDFFARLRRNRREPVSQADAQLAMRIIGDQRIWLPRDAVSYIRSHVAPDPALSKKVAAALFARLESVPADARDADPNYLGWHMGYVGDAIAALPDDAIRPYRPQLEALARDREGRVRAWRALKRLSVFGGSAVPTLLYLIDDVGDVEPKRGNDWQHPFLAGMQGLCAMGEDGRSAIPAIYERMETGVVPPHYWKITVKTLVNLGAEPEDVQPRITRMRNKPEPRFERLAERSRSKKDCSY